MKVLSSAIVSEKNKISTDGVWLVLLEISFPGEESVYLVHNTEDITWGGNLWQAFPFEVNTVSEDGQGGLPSYTIRVSNVGRALTVLIDEHDGGNGATTILRVVHSEHLEDLNPVFMDVATIVACSVDLEWVTFTLGAENPMILRSPRQRYLQNHCRYKEFKGALCAYAGPVGVCDRTMATCKELGNLARFGGAPGISLGEGVYLT